MSLPGEVRDAPISSLGHAVDGAFVLGGCGSGEQPRPADFVPPASAQSDYGALRVRYNALPSLSLGEAMAREYGVARDENTALVIVALRQLRDGEEIDADGTVSVQATDLAGKRQTVALRPVRAGEYTDQIGTLKVSRRDTVRFEIAVDALGRQETVKFQRNF